VADYEAASAATREARSLLSVPYGEGPDEKLDLFFLEETPGGTLPDPHVRPRLLAGAVKGPLRFRRQ
jgi:hypothetical protein